MLTPVLAGLSEPRQQLFLFTLSLIDRFRGDGLDAASDDDAASAAAALAGTYETASRGLIYEQRPDSVPAQRMADGIRGMFEPLGRGRPSGFAADAAEVLRQVEDRIRAVQRTAHGDSRAFVGLAARMARRLGAGLEGPPVEGEPERAAGRGSPSIILP